MSSAPSEDAPPENAPPENAQASRSAASSGERAETGTTATRPRVLSGIQPTADSFHLGNYLGALREWVAMQEAYDAFYCVVDLHSITMGHDPDVLRERTRVSVAQLLALGIDPDRSTLFVQSQVPEHVQLTWVLECLTSFGEANRMTQFKDKAARQQEDQVSVGLFTYPALMAADILIYQADAVPVGEDQRQHLELTRTLAQRFNTRFGTTFTVPEARIPREAAKIFDLQHPGTKMSKSLPAGVVDLLEDPKRLAKKVRSAVTDTGREIRHDPDNKPGISNLLVLYSRLSDRSLAELESAYEGHGYGELKKDLGELLVEFVTPFQRKVREYLDDPAELDSILGRGAAHAREVAGPTLRTAFERVGFLASSR